MVETSNLKEIVDLLRNSHKDALSRIITIDSRDGAGKSWLAKNLSNLIGAGVVSLDPFLRENQGAYVRNLDLTAIRTALEACATPKIIEGVCVLEVLDSLDCRPDVLIYVKKIRFGYVWLEDDMLERDPAEPIEQLIRRKSLTPFTEEVIRYHDKYLPSKKADIIFHHHV